MLTGHTALIRPFEFSDIRALWRSGLSARVPECQKIQKGGLEQYGAERFGRLILPQSEKCGNETVKLARCVVDMLRVHRIQFRLGLLTL